ncbi:O-antigen ligase family protein, partial [bacterium]|nr:O-antigen ligase family protein [bacterium]
FRLLNSLGSFTILCILPLACSTLLYDTITAPKLAALWLGTALVCAGTALQKLHLDTWDWPRHPLLKLSVAISLWSFFSCAINGFHVYAIPSIINTILLLALLVAWAISLRRQDIWQYAGWLSIIAFIMGFYSHLQRITPAKLQLGAIQIKDFMDWQPAHLAYERTIATMGNPDYFATYLAALLPLALIWVLTRLRGWQEWLGLLCWCSSATAMVLTQTRSAWLGAAASIPVWLVMVWRASDSAQRSHLGKRLAVALAITLVSVYGLYEWQKSLHPQLDLGDRIKNFANQDDLSIQARYYFWHTALRSAVQHPLTGLGGGGHAVRSMQDRDIEPVLLRFPPRQMENVHSQYLQTLAEYSWIGLLLLILCLAAYAKALSGKRDLLSAGLISSAAALWVSQLFICSTITTDTLWVFLIAAAIVLSAEDNTAECGCTQDNDEALPASDEALPASNEADLPPDWHRLFLPTVVGLFCVCFAGAAAFISLRCEYDMLKGNKLHYLGNRCAASAEYKDQANKCYLRAEQYLMRALAAAPIWKQADIYLELGKLVDDMYINLSDCTDQALYENAQECFKEAIRFNPYYPYTYSCLAILHNQADQLPAALKCTEQALQLDPRNPQYLNQKALILLQDKRYREARDTAMQALGYCPISPNLWHTLAKAHRYMGEYSQAEQDLENLLRLDPNAGKEAEKIRAIKAAPQNSDSAEAKDSASDKAETAK